MKMIKNNLKIYVIIVLALLGIALAFGAKEVPANNEYVQLIENTDQCFNCYTIYRICNPTNQAIAIDSLDGFNIKLYDKNGDRYSGLDENGDIVTNIEGASFDIENLELTYKVIEDYNVDVPDYVDCQRDYTILSNETGKEETVFYDTKCLSGYHQEPRQRTVWNDFNPITKASLQPGECVEVKISGNIDWKQAVDNVVSLAGQEFKEYAWWNSSWTKRKMINITNNDGVEVLRKWHTINITLDTTGASFQDDCDDLRITYNASGTNIELDRVVTGCNLSNTTVEFALQANISASSTSTNEYWVYYDNPSATVPTVNKSNVYLYWCDFSANGCGLIEVDGGADLTYNATGGRYDFDIDRQTETILYQNISAEITGANLNGYELTYTWYVTGWENDEANAGTGFAWKADDMSGLSGNTPASDFIWWGSAIEEWVMVRFDSTNAYDSGSWELTLDLNTNMYMTFYRLNKSSNMNITYYSNSARTTVVDSKSLTSSSAEHKYFILLNNWNTGSNNGEVSGWVDDVKLIRRLLTNPTFALGTEEQQDTDATESEGRAAIETGITNALGAGAAVYTDQQIYIRYLNGTQSLGTFDKVASYGSQRWAFNYVTDGESFTNINSLGTTVNIWENQSLTTTQITNQVETFINSTKN